MYDYLVVRVDRSETCKPLTSIPPWELAVLEAAAGGAACEVIDRVSVRRELPEPADEMTRLSNKYKGDSPGAPPVAVQVYGVGARGVEVLASEIKKVSTFKVSEGGDAAPAGDAETTEDVLGSLGLLSGGEGQPQSIDE